ncbi:MAG: response regulator transcription factor [Coriobacteriia bacterium]
MVTHRPCVGAGRSLQRKERGFPRLRGGLAAAADGQIPGGVYHLPDLGEETWVPVLVPASALSHVAGFVRLAQDGAVLPPLHLAQPEKAHDCLDDRCRQLAESCGLSARELEVLGYIARGRNAQHLEKRLGISLSTAKTHISHVYRKLGVGSQQKLLDLIEG